MKCQNLFSGKNKENISICRLLIFLSRVLSVKTGRFLQYFLIYKNICTPVPFEREKTSVSF